MPSWARLSLPGDLLPGFAVSLPLEIADGVGAVLIIEGGHEAERASSGWPSNRIRPF